MYFCLVEIGVAEDFCNKAELARSSLLKRGAQVSPRTVCSSLFPLFQDNFD